jgi:hypothetical protein
MWIHVLNPRSLLDLRRVRSHQVRLFCGLKFICSILVAMIGVWKWAETWERTLCEALFMVGPCWLICRDCRKSVSYLKE